MLVKQTGLAGLFAVASYFTTAFAGNGPASAVLTLNPLNFDDVVFSEIPTLVEFYAPWCGHCQKLEPIYEKLAESFAHAKKKVQIAKVDADAERSLGSRFEVGGFPTLKWFDGKSKSPEDYRGGRSIEALTSYITTKTNVKPRQGPTLPSNVVLLSDNTFAKEVGGDKDVFVAFTAPWCGHCKDLAKPWEDLAQTFANERGVLIAKVDTEAEDSKNTATEQEISSYPTIKFFPRGKKEPVEYTDGRSGPDFVSFLNKHSGTHRIFGGGLAPTAGIVPDLDEIIQKYLGGTSLTETVEEAKNAISNLGDKSRYVYAEYYLKVLKKLGDGDGYVAQELARLDGMIKKHGLAPAKLDELTSKTNILRSFSAKRPDSEASEKLQKEAKEEAKEEPQVEPEEELGDEIEEEPLEVHLGRDEL